MSVCPSGCVCQAVRAPGSNVTPAPLTRAGSGALNSGSMRTVPVNHSGGHLPDGCVPFRLISIVLVLRWLVTAHETWRALLSSLWLRHSQSRNFSIQTAQLIICVVTSYQALASPLRVP